MPKNHRLISDYIAPHQRSYLDDNYDSYRTHISLSSFRSRYGKPLIQDAIEPLKELAEKFLKAVEKRVKPQDRYSVKTSTMWFLGRPIYSVNQSGFGFIDNNYGNYAEGITTVPNVFGTEYDVQSLFDCIKTSAEKPVIVEKVHIKKITERMPSAADYVLRRFKRNPFRHSDVICLNLLDLDT
jgi:hypothetical protein